MITNSGPSHRTRDTDAADRELKAEAAASVRNRRNGSPATQGA